MKEFILACLGIFLLHQVSAQITVSAGTDKTICPGSSTTLGGSPSATGGVTPYTYSWQPTTGLSSVSVANPACNANQNTTYTLTVTDKDGNTATDIVQVTIDAIINMSAGADKDYCLGQSSGYSLGVSANQVAGYTFNWLPDTFLNNNLLAQPLANPGYSISYSLTITSPTCGSKSDVVSIFVHSLQIDAGTDTSIEQGQTITLFASPNDSSLSYFWSPANNHIKYQLTYAPDVYPVDTVTYYLQVIDQFGCAYYDSVRVNVKRSDNLFFYNTFTPNGDGENDTWNIGNVEKYPDNHLQVFNRYGQLIYSKHAYSNDWDGKYLGVEIPAGTYFYLFDTKTPKGKFKGSVSIFR